VAVDVGVDFGVDAEESGEVESGEVSGGESERVPVSPASKNEEDIWPLLIVGRGSDGERRVLCVFRSSNAFEEI